MDRCVVLVDAGYLMGAAATLLAQNGLRSSITADFKAMLSDIVEQAVQRTGLPVLRVLWYDAAIEARPTHEHLTLGGLQDVKVRLGVLVRHGGRTEQKGVDSFLQRDLTTLARNGAVADIVLIGGDEDLRRGVVEAQDYGVKVHLWGVWAAAPRFNQAPTLVAEADRRWVLSEDWVRRHIRLRPDAIAAEFPLESAADEPLVDDDAEAAADDVADVAGEVLASGDALRVDTAEPFDVSPVVGTGRTERTSAPAPEHATPAVMAQFVQPPSAPSSMGHQPALAPSPGSGSGVGTGPVTVREEIRLPNLAALTSQRQEWRDNEEDTVATLNPEAVGERYGRRWASRASAAERHALLRGYPTLPRALDGELLKFAFNRGIDTWEDEPAKFAVRAAVWRAVEAEEAKTGESHQSGDQRGATLENDLENRGDESVDDPTRPATDDIVS